MKILWMSSLRPLAISKANDLIQDNFINSVRSLDCPIEFSFTQFDERGVKKFLKKKKITKFYTNFSKKVLPFGKKYSNKIMLEYALDQFLKNDFTHLVYSTADIVVPSNLIDNLNKFNKHNKDYCALIYPNILCKNGLIQNSFWPHYGIDLFVFKISKAKAKLFKKSIKSWNQYDWGIPDNFYVSVCELLGIKIFNMFKNSSVIKYENNFKKFKESDKWRTKSWIENNNFFKIFLKSNNLSLSYSNLSYYYILYKIFNFKDISLKLLISYFLFYTYFPLEKLRKFISSKIKSFL